VSQTCILCNTLLHVNKFSINLSIIETTVKITLFCNGCKSAKFINKFIGLKAKDALKQFHTYNNCHNKPHMNVKKRQNKNKES